MAQCVWKWSDEYHDDDSTGVPSPSRADVNPKPVEELAFVTLIKHFRGYWSYVEEMEMAVFEWLAVQEPVKFVTSWGIYISVVFDYFGK